MTVDGIVPVPLAAAGSDSSGTLSNEDWAKFEQAFLDAMPSAAMFMLQTIASDTVMEVASTGDEQNNN